jgi:hypothetical protein
MMLEKNMRYMHSLTDEDTTEYFRYMKKKYADNKEIVDFCDKVLDDKKLTAACTIIYQQCNRARLAKTGTTAEPEISEIIAEIMTIGLSIMRLLFIVMIVGGIAVGIVAGFSAIFYSVENGPLIAIFLLLLFVIIMLFKKEWLEGKINEWEDGKL